MAEALQEGGLILLGELENDPLLEAAEIVHEGNQALMNHVVHDENREARRPVRIQNFVEAIVPTYSDPTFKSHFRMHRATVENLVQLLTPHLSDKIVPIPHKILATLWLLGNQESFRGVADRFNFNKSSLHKFVLEVCESLKTVRENFLAWPSRNQLDSLVDSFRRKTGFVGVVGCIDGTHIPIPGPSDHREDYINRKGFPSIQLQAICDSNMRFIDILAGWPGSVHDARVFRSSPVHNALENGCLPEEYHLLGDSAYALTPYMIVPFRDDGHLTPEQRAFNKLHSSTRVVIERAFGLLKCKFRRLKYLNMHLMEKIPVVISATCVLHNFILLREKIDPRDLDEIEFEEILLRHDADDPPARQQLQAGRIKRNELVALLI